VYDITKEETVRRGNLFTKRKEKKRRKEEKKKRKSGLTPNQPTAGSIGC